MTAMPTYIALLRGINVGRNILKMERLRALCQELGMSNVRTYVQSGNVVFQAKGSAAEWTAELERKLVGETRLPVWVTLRTAAELAVVLAGNPFLEEKGVDRARLAVAFLQQALSKTDLEALHLLKGKSERFHCVGKEIYLHCPQGFADSKLYSPDKALSQRTTTRNWNTVKKLCEMSAP
jgi:uncharacterized protein (DUF1697 family)